jgi:hypothetical protein
MIRKAPHPHETLRAIEITELSDHFHTDGFLRLDELAVEEFDQHVSLAAPEGVLAKLNHRAARGHHAVSSTPRTTSPNFDQVPNQGCPNTASEYPDTEASCTAGPISHGAPVLAIECSLSLAPVAV